MILFLISIEKGLLNHNVMALRLGVRLILDSPNGIQEYFAVIGFHYEHCDRVSNHAGWFTEAIVQSANITQPIQKTVCVSLYYRLFYVLLKPKRIELAHCWIFSCGPSVIG